MAEKSPSSICEPELAAWYLARMVDCCCSRSLITKGMAPPGTPAWHSLSFSSAAILVSFRWGECPHRLAVVFCKLL